MLKGITITLLNREIIGEDSFKEPIYQDNEIEVENVLVAPVSSANVPKPTDFEGIHTMYTLAIPKGDSNCWTNQKVKFFDKVWSVVGEPVEGIENMLPLSWNKKVMVERYE